MTLSDNRIKRLVEETLDRIGRGGRLNKLTAPCPGPTNKLGMPDGRYRAPHWFDGVHDWGEAVHHSNNGMGRGNPCNFWCSKCGWMVDMCRFGRPYRNEQGNIERRCLNKGDDRTHMQERWRTPGRCRTTISSGMITHHMPPTDEDRDDGERWVDRGGEGESGR